MRTVGNTGNFKYKCHDCTKTTWINEVQRALGVVKALKCAWCGSENIKPVWRSKAWACDNCSRIQ